MVSIYIYINVFVPYSPPPPLGFVFLFLWCGSILFFVSIYFLKMFHFLIFSSILATNFTFLFNKISIFGFDTIDFFFHIFSPLINSLQQNGVKWEICNTFKWAKCVCYFQFDSISLLFFLRLGLSIDADW